MSNDENEWWKIMENNEKNEYGYVSVFIMVLCIFYYPPPNPLRKGGGISRIATYNRGGNYIMPTCVVILRFRKKPKYPKDFAESRLHFWILRYA